MGTWQRSACAALATVALTVFMAASTWGCVNKNTLVDWSRRSDPEWRRLGEAQSPGGQADAAGPTMDRSSQQGGAQDAVQPDVLRAVIGRAVILRAADGSEVRGTLLTVNAESAVMELGSGDLTSVPLGVIVHARVDRGEGVDRGR